MITYQLETWKKFFASAPPLWQTLQNELHDVVSSVPGQEKIAPNAKAYEHLDRLGRLMIVTVRDGEELVGYATTAIHEHPHFMPLKVAFGDAMYLAPKHRKGLAGAKLFTFTEKKLKELKVQRYYMPVYPRGGQETIFKRLKFTPEHSVYSKWIGD